MHREVLSSERRRHSPKLFRPEGVLLHAVHVPFHCQERVHRSWEVGDVGNRDADSGSFSSTLVSVPSSESPADYDAVPAVHPVGS